MGREIRRVPPNWEHPKVQRDWGIDYQPKYNRNYDKSAQEWIDECLLWSKGEDPRQNESEIARDCKYFWEYDGDPPDREYYLDYDPDDKSLCTWWQCYETVSEGTPVSPPFATKEELIDYLATYGDFWEQDRAKEQGRPVRPSSRESVERFVSKGHAFSMVSVVRDGKVEVAAGIDTMELLP